MFSFILYVASQAATALLKRYIRSAQEQERQLRTELKTRLNQEETEKRELIAEIKRTQTSMDDLSEKHRELIEDVVERDNEVSRLKVGGLFAQATVMVMVFL